jgi:indolepyruvate ferredoxin oxidoreductase beta subunit
MLDAEPIKIAILAMGGEGGGVLADWVVDLGESNGYFAQTTSVPGVAQRTGATIYYVELFPGADLPGARAPVLAQVPMPGDVDIVMASELMEAGRAVQRGFVTADRTTLITSTHRVYSIAEKVAMGDGRVDGDRLLGESRKAARRCISFDMAAVAADSASVISAVLFGALCGAEVLPFNRQQFEHTIERGGVGVKSSLKAFASGVERARADPVTTLASDAPGLRDAGAAQARHPEVARLLAHAQRFEKSVADTAVEGIRRLIDYQDVAYARLYLERLDALAAAKGVDHLLLSETARHLALWMSYEDVIRVADLKTRASRFERVEGEASVQSGQVLQIDEFMHPRLEEICETLPAGLGRWLARPHAVNRIAARLTREGRVVRTSSVRGFMLLYLLARWRRGRRSTLRFELENRRIETWLGRLRDLAGIDPALALETARCQRLVKGYGDTHARGLGNYECLMAVVDRHAHRLAPASLKALREAALADEHGHRLQALIAQWALGTPTAN